MIGDRVTGGAGFAYRLEQWYSTWGTRTPGGTRRHVRGYVKFKKNIIS